MAHVLASNSFVVLYGYGNIDTYLRITASLFLKSNLTSSRFFKNQRTIRKRKLTLDTSNDLHIPETPRIRFKRGSDRDFQTRMEICVLAKRGLTPKEITKTLGCTWDMASWWSKRSEEVIQN